MDASSSFLVRHGDVTLFVLIFVDQLGVPVPGVPFLLGAGALAATGRSACRSRSRPRSSGRCSPTRSALSSAGARGRRRCASSAASRSSPTSACGRAPTIFERNVLESLLVKFVPGIDLMAPPIAGMIGMLYCCFTLLNAIRRVGVGGDLPRASAGSSTGQIESVTAFLERMGAPLGAAAGGVIVVYVLAGSSSRGASSSARLRTQRVRPDEVMRQLAANEPLFIVDLRQNLDYSTDPRTLPGARRISVEEFENRHVEIPRDRDVVLYCT